MAKEKKQLSAQEQKVADSKRAEQKSAKFVELAQKRMTKALAAIGNIGNLANRSSYNYNADQVAKLTTALANSVKSVAERFNAPAAQKSKTGFTF